MEILDDRSGDPGGGGYHRSSGAIRQALLPRGGLRRVSQQLPAKPGQASLNVGACIKGQPIARGTGIVRGGQLVIREKWLSGWGADAREREGEAP